MACYYSCGIFHNNLYPLHARDELSSRIKRKYFSLYICGIYHISLFFFIIVTRVSTLAYLHLFHNISVIQSFLPLRENRIFTRVKITDLNNTVNNIIQISCKYTIFFTCEDIISQYGFLYSLCLQ